MAINGDLLDARSISFQQTRTVRGELVEPLDPRQH